MNILRNNSSVGIIALGMTFVIISGGIDLAVGSTLVAVGAITMTLIDAANGGWLGAIGLTGAPAYIVAILFPSRPASFSAASTASWSLRARFRRSSQRSVP